jgi:alkanesulfonate monooxygenase
MTLNIYWQIDSAAQPARAEPSRRPAWSASLADPRGPLADRTHHYGQIARAAALTAFDGLFIPYRPESDDSQILAAALARLVPTLRLVPEFPASIGSAVYAAKEAVSFQRATHDRLGWAIAHGRSAEERRADGDVLPDGEQAARLEEFLTVARGVHGGKGYSFKGRHFEVLNGGFDAPLDRVAFPTVFLQGDGEDDIAVSARHADVHLFGDLPPDVLRERIETLDAAALAAGRTVAFGQRIALTARETRDEAAAVRGAGGIVGDYDGVAGALAERARIGVSHFVLTAEPGLEEAYRIGASVLPRLRARLRTASLAA